MNLDLNTADRHTALMSKLEVHLDERIGNLKGKLAGDMSEEQTWKLRGAIGELTTLRDAFKELPEVSNTELR